MFEIDFFFKLAYLNFLIKIIRYVFAASVLFFFAWGIGYGYISSDNLIKDLYFIYYWFAGVIWKGDKLIDGVPETLDMLRSKVCIWM